MKKIILLTLLISNCLSAQFELNGAASTAGLDTFILTPALNSQFGAIWYKIQHNLNEKFYVKGKMNFGNIPNGADGIAFVMQQNCLIAGGIGGGLGFSNLNGNTFAVEFDTYQNIQGTGAELNNDPIFDHIAVEKNGDVVHDNSANDITDPIQMDAVLTNVKTGDWYDFEISYDPATTNIIVNFNLVERVNINYNLLSNIFLDKKDIYWGFTSTTGGFINEQQIIIDTAFLSFQLNDTIICAGTNGVEINLPTLDKYQGTNLAIAKQVFSSTGIGTNLNSIDNNVSTFWESQVSSNNQWIYIDFNVYIDLDSVKLNWADLFPITYDIQTSVDGVNWSTNTTFTGNTGGINVNSFIANNIKFMRVLIPETGIFRLNEIEVFGKPKYLWSPNDGSIDNVFGSNVNLNPIVTTTYELQIPDNCLGYTSIEMTVEIIPRPDANFTYSIINEDTNFDLAFLNHSSAATNYSWDFGDGAFYQTANLDSIFHNYEVGSYQIELIASNDYCSDKYILNILLSKDFTIPNIFTPNDDLKNDSFKIDYLKLDNFSIVILNRWGNEVFSSTDLNFSWNGKSQQNKNCSDGVYFYKILYTNDLGENASYQGNIQLIR